MNSLSFSLPELEATAALVNSVVPPTPQHSWPLLSRRAGADVWVKHENHTIIGAFKVRGGITFLDDLMRSQPSVKGVISATRGNHGQSIGFAARRYGIAAVMVVPHGNSREKNAAMRAQGVELIEYGDDFQAGNEYVEVLAKERGLFRVPSFHPLLVRGVSTYSLEFFRAVPDLDTVYIPIGMGSGICGAIVAREALGLKTKIVGVVSASAPTYALSFSAGKGVPHAVTTRIADGIAIRRPDELSLSVILNKVERVVQVTDNEVEAAMRAYFTDTHNVAEGAGAAGLAALLQEREKMKGRKVGLVLTGGNVDLEVFARVLEGAAVTAA